MTRVIGTPQSRRRRWLFLCTSFAAIALAVIFIPSAFAVHEFSMQLDGDVSTHAYSVPGSQGIDWGANTCNVADSAPNTCVTGIAGQTDTAHSIFLASRNGAGTTESVDPNPATVGSGKAFDAANFQRDFESGASCALNSTSTTRCGADDTTYATGSKDTLGIANGGWQCNHDNNVNNKVDINNAYIASFWTGGSAGNGDHILYAGIEKEKNNGTNDIGVWFLQNGSACSNPNGGAGLNWTGGHRNGDVLVVSEFSNGGGVSTVKTFTWRASTDPNSPFFGDGGCIDSRPGFFNPNSKPAGCNGQQSGGGGDCKSATVNDTTCATTNALASTGGGAAPYQGTVSTPWLASDATLGIGNNQVVAPDFIEMGIDITKLFSAEGGTAPTCFNTAVPDTRSSPSVTATLFDYTVNTLGECKSSIVTTPKAGDGTSAPPSSIGTGSVSVKDSAQVTVTGVSTWSGTVKFFLCGPIASGNCSSGGTQIGAAAGISVNQGTSQPILSDAATVTSAGRYCWRAEFAAVSPADIPPASDPNANSVDPNSECFTLAPVTPSLTTNATGPVVLGNPIDDTAHLTGTANEPGSPVINPTTAGGPAGGSITFNLYGPSASPDCSAGQLIATRTISVSGDGFYTASDGTGTGSLTPGTAGTYYWVASYTGDPPNTNSAAGGCGDANESSTVGSSSLTTTPKASDGTSAPPTSIGTAGSVQVKDSAVLTVNGVTTWSGTVKFFLCKVDSPNTCDSGGTQIGAAAGIPVDQTTTNPIVSDAATVTSAGRYCWRGVFTSATTGVPNASDHSSGECFTLAPVTPTLTTNATGPVVLGNPIDDTAHLTGTANEPGTPVINPTTPGGPAGGTITFNLFGPSANPDCSLGQLIATRTLNVSGDGFYTASDGTGSGSLTPTLVGTYYWVASYTGDPPNTNSAAGGCGDANESSTVGSSSLTTTPKAADGTSDPPTSIGTAGSVQVTDSANLTVNGVTTWSGTLTFFLCKVDSPNTCDSGGTQIGSGIPVDQTTTNPIVSDAATVTSAGRYCWRGVFTSGTTGVPDASDHSTGECFTLAPVTPSLSTNATGPVRLGDPIDDTAHLTGTANEPGTPVINPTTAGGPAQGSITFNLYGPSANPDCSAGQLIATRTVSVNGDGFYTASDGSGSGSLTPSTTGTYYWVASYSGDSPNTNPAAGSCGDANESSTIVDAKISITPTATNGITESHTFTVTLMKDLGDGNGFVAAAGEHVDVTLTDAGGASHSTPTGSCTTAGPNTDANGQCTITFTSNSAGTVTGHASSTLSVGGSASFTVQTDGKGDNSGDAVKTFVQGSLKWLKHDGSGNLLGGATFQVCATAGTAASVGHTPLCVDVVDNVGQAGYTGADSDPIAGQFELDKYQSFGGTALGGLALGTYTITETVPPAGFQLDSFVDTETIDQDHLNVIASHTFVDTQPGQGCTPGFWKNHQSAWNGPTVNPTDQTIINLEKVLTPDVTTTFAYSTSIPNFNNQLFGQVFWLSGTNLRGLSSSLTLLGALNLGGGGFQALARHGTAGLLSSASVQYPYTTLQVLNGVHNAFVANNSNQISTTFPDGVLTDLSNANNLNEQACPTG